jgi:alkylation response protein AidB-like acyl-CoA dehydrogenase
MIFIFGLHHGRHDPTLLLSKHGMIAPNWPSEHGGMGLTPAKFLIFMEEQERLGVSRAPDMGVVMIGPVLIRFGTAQQRQYYLPKIIACEHIWCQGYSEPNAGSDLASLRCEAVLDGDDFVVTGQKTWTTLAQDATHIFMLVRTDKTAKKQEGISFLLADCTLPGITVRPIRNLAGHEEFSEVFFDAVRVPRKNIVGEINQGWTIAKALLGFERLFLGSPKQSHSALQRLENLARRLGRFDDPVFLDKFTQAQMDVADLSALYARFADLVRQGKPLGADTSMLKIFATETFSRITQLILETAGSAGALAGQTEIEGETFDILTPFYNARPATIYGGSNEIQRGILAKQVLKLPD